MIELHQFRYSHFNEKARWALDYKDIPHRRISYLPGPHAAKIKALSGQAQTPVVKFDNGEVLAGSTPILEALEERFPEPPLIPSDPAERAAAMEWVRYFDEDVAAAERRAFFYRAVDEPAYLASMFAADASPPMRFVYRWMLPMVRSRMFESMGITGKASADQGVAVTEAALDRVAEAAKATGYLVGGRFTIADLTAAAILAPAVNPDHPEMKRPEPMPPVIAEWTQRFYDHPGAKWVRGIYARHRAGPGLAQAA